MHENAEKQCNKINCKNLLSLKRHTFDTHQTMRKVTIKNTMILRKIIVKMLKINTFKGQQSLIILYLLFLAVNGSWSGWSDWSLCSVTCGSGVITRTRDCTHPSPLFGGQNCSGEDTETQPCNRTTCPCESVGAGLMLTLNYFKFHIQT